MMAAWWQHMLYSIIYCIQLFIVFNYLLFKLCYIASYFIIQCNIVFIQYCITMFHHIVSDHILWDFMIFCFMILHYYIVRDIMCLEDILIRLNSELISLSTYQKLTQLSTCEKLSIIFLPDLFHWFFFDERSLYMIFI